MQVLHGYTLDESQWKAKGGGGQVNIATKNGKQYFIKRLTKPRYPESSKYSGEFKRQKIKECDEWFRYRKAIADTLPGIGTGTLIKPIEYFREGPCYYEVANLVDVTSIPYDQIWKESKQDKARIMLTVAMSLADVHRVGIVHCDLDPGNILISRSASGNLVTKLIDFTDAFFENDPPQTIMSKDFWWSPEVALYSKAADQVPNPYKKYISTKADVFSLGIVFHQYCAKNGIPPICQCQQPWQEFQRGRKPRISPEIEPEFAKLIQSMLEVEPKNRPSMQEVHSYLLGILKGHQYAGETTIAAAEPAADHTHIKQEPVGSSSDAGSYYPGIGKSGSGAGVKSVETLNAKKVRINFTDGKSQIMDIKLAMIQHYIK